MTGIGAAMAAAQGTFVGQIQKDSWKTVHTVNLKDILFHLFQEGSAVSGRFAPFDRVQQPISAALPVIGVIFSAGHAQDRCVFRCLQRLTCQLPFHFFRHLQGRVNTDPVKDGSVSLTVGIFRLFCRESTVQTATVTVGDVGTFPAGCLHAVLFCL